MLLAAAVFLMLGGPLPAALNASIPDAARRLLPGLSPLMAVSETLSQRTWYLGIFWWGPPAVVLAMAIWRGRWFCRWICPAGTVFSLAAVSRSGKRRPPLIRRSIAPVLFYMILFSSAAGLPLFLSLDPLSSFNRLVLLPSVPAAWVPGLIVPVFVVLGLFQPMLWCSRVCLLGYAYDFAGRIVCRPVSAFMPDRRRILAGLLLGVPAALILPRVLRRKGNVILPPGAGDIERFSAACTWCYACVAACPNQIITVRASGALGQMFVPEIDYSKGLKVCREQCHACTQACPSGAIQTLTLKQKQHVQIACAKVRRNDCIAWSGNQACMVCDEYCPYNAIEAVFRPEDTYKDVPLPIINPDKCRGCGYCLSACVAPGKAIDILPIARQRTLQGNEQRHDRVDL